MAGLWRFHAASVFNDGNNECGQGQIFDGLRYSHDNLLLLSYLNILIAI
ncbi:MAG: hypothetical protein K0B00_00610 [Rhodobacteraceae bacterium]|nr:hypothetical protein [Paracoccaceae bacterium]